MKRIFIIITLLFISGFIFAQLNISGIVIDSADKSIIPFATLEILSRRTGTVANDKGVFKWNIDEKYINDTVIISALGYDKSRIVLKDILKQKKIEIRLSSKIFSLQTIEIKNIKPKTINVGSRKIFALFTGMGSLPGQIIASYINVDSNNNGFIKTVGVYLLKRGRPDAPFRIRLLNLEKDIMLPGDDMIKESLILNNSEGGKWVDINVSKYHIPIPKKGFFIAIEWIKTKDEYYYKEGYLDYGPVVGVTYEFKKCNTFSKSLGNIWWNWNFIEPDFSLMVRAKLEVWEN